jgi:hypothetical protein
MSTGKRGRPRKFTLDFGDIKIHPAASLLPSMSREEFAGLVEDIRTHGLLQPIVTIRDAEGLRILEGRHRALACPAAGIEPRFQEYEGTDPVGFVLSANIHRRHLTPRDRRKLIVNLLKLQPELSNRQIAAKVKAHHETVAAVREEEESRGEIRHVDVHIDTKGRKQPAKKVELEIKQEEAEARERQVQVLVDQVRAGVGRAEAAASAEAMKAKHAALESEIVEPNPAHIIDECVAGVLARIQQALHALTAEDDRSVLREKLQKVLDALFGASMCSGRDADMPEMPAFLIRTQSSN